MVRSTKMNFFFDFSSYLIAQIRALRLRRFSSQRRCNSPTSLFKESSHQNTKTPECPVSRNQSHSSEILSGGLFLVPLWTHFKTSYYFYFYYFPGNNTNNLDFFSILNYVFVMYRKNILFGVVKYMYYSECFHCRFRFDF